MGWLSPFPLGPGIHLLFTAPAPTVHLTAIMCLATASGPSRSVSQARTVRAFSIVSAVVNVLLRNESGEGEWWVGGHTGREPMVGGMTAKRTVCASSTTQHHSAMCQKTLLQSPPE